VQCRRGGSKREPQRERHAQGKMKRNCSPCSPYCYLLLLLLKELGDGQLLGVSCCLDLLACPKVVVAADARVPCPVLVLPPLTSQLLVALWPDAAAAIRAGDLWLSPFVLPTNAVDMRPDDMSSLCCGIWCKRHNYKDSHLAMPAPVQVKNPLSTGECTSAH
jgi:hypothetical protein